ncbi:uncharacterized protein LOC135107563 [Scylla paramamosain]|uniref:uncharacterized protein LOC135107563 n=1 Tax=Scylla paramamosain TaxID=85552 RepID=UPI003082A00D
MSCGLPYYCDGDGGGAGGGGGGGVQKPSCSCSISCRPVLPTSPTHPYLSLPYVVLTKHMANLYRKKIINKKLLRHLAGDWEDVEAARQVRLRKHRTECSIHTGGESSSESDDDTPQHHQQSKSTQPCSDSECSSDSSSGYWVGGGPTHGEQNQGFNVFSPLPSRKLYHPPAPSQASSNLQKWRFQASPIPGSLSTSEESGASSEGSNPYGYIRYFNSDNPSTPLQDEEGPCRRFTYTQPSQEPHVITQGEKSSSCNDFYNMSEDPWATPGLTAWGHHRQEHLQQVSEDSQDYFPKESCKKVAELQVPRIIVPGHPSSNLPSLTLSQSHPTLTPQQSEEDQSFIRIPPRAKTVHSSTLTIPAAPMLLAGLAHPQRASECVSSESSANVCNKTIYEPSSSSCEGTDPEKVPWVGEKSEKRMFPFKTKPDIAYYVSSCSGDETGEDGADYYESHRRPEPLVLALSHSEPNLCLPSTQEIETQNKSPKYSSHYVQLVLPLEGPATKVCNCEAHSHRSSDSGLADVIHHLECCPLRTDTPGLGRGSGTSHSSHSSQLSSTKFLQGPSWYPVRAFTPDSLLPTPVTSPNTSAPVSYAEDSLTSLLDSVSLQHSPAEQETGAEEGVYRSGLYAHWWMKASVCPRLLVLDRSRKDYLRFRAEKKPDVPPKPRFLKPSYHVRRGGNKGGVVKPVARCAATQTSSSPPAEDHQCAHPRLKKTSLHLSPQTSLTMSRDRSFESQVSQISQVTVVPRLRRERESQTGSGARPGVHTLQVLGKNSQESSGTDLSSLHSFSESCEGAGQQPHLRDSCEGLDVDFQRRASSHSLHTTATSSSASSAPYKSTLYWHLPSAHGGSAPQQFGSLSSQSSSGATLTGNLISPPMEGFQNFGRPTIPPKPIHLQSWPIQRSRSLPRLPVPTTISVHTQSKDHAS